VLVGRFSGRDKGLPQRRDSPAWARRWLLGRAEMVHQHSAPIREARQLSHAGPGKAIVLASDENPVWVKRSLRGGRPRFCPTRWV